MKSPTEKNTEVKNTEARTGTLAGIFRSSLVAGVIALVIYLAIFALTTGGLDLTTGLLIAAITFVITFMISAIIGAVARRRER